MQELDKRCNNLHRNWTFYILLKLLTPIISLIPDNNKGNIICEDLRVPVSAKRN